MSLFLRDIFIHLSSVSLLPFRCICRRRRNIVSPYNVVYSDVYSAVLWLCRELPFIPQVISLTLDQRTRAKNKHYRAPYPFAKYVGGVYVRVFDAKSTGAWSSKRWIDFVSLVLPGDCIRSSLSTENVRTMRIKDPLQRPPHIQVFNSIKSIIVNLSPLLIPSHPRAVQRFREFTTFERTRNDAFAIHCRLFDIDINRYYK